MTKWRTERTVTENVDSIIEAMTPADRIKMGLHGAYHPDMLLHRFVLEADGQPVAFLDVSGDTTGAAIAVGVHPAYRRKGYGVKLVRMARGWIADHRKELGPVVWWTRRDNIASAKLAQKMGLILDRASVEEDNPWIMYKE